MNWHLFKNEISRTPWTDGLIMKLYYIQKVCVTVTVKDNITLFSSACDVDFFRTHYRFNK